MLLRYHCKLLNTCRRFGGNYSSISKNVILYISANKAGIRERTSRPASHGSYLSETLRNHWNNRKYGASELNFPQAKGFLRHLSAFWACAHTNVCHSFPRPKKFEESLFERASNHLLARAAHMHWDDPASQSEASIAWCPMWVSNIVSCITVFTLT